MTTRKRMTIEDHDAIESARKTIRANASAKPKMKPRGGNSPVIGDNGVHTNPGDNSRYASIMMDMLNLPPLDHKDINALELRLKWYIAYCHQHDVKPSNLGAYLALDIDKTNAYDWENGSRTPAHSNFIKKVKKICAFTREQLMAENKLNPVVGIFWQKNFDGFKDVQDVVLTPHNPLGDIQDVETLQRRLAADIPDE